MYNKFIVIADKAKIQIEKTHQVLLIFVRYKLRSVTEIYVALLRELRPMTSRPTSATILDPTKRQIDLADPISLTDTNMYEEGF